MKQGKGYNRVLSREHTDHGKHPIPTTRGIILYTWTAPDGQYQNQIDFFSLQLKIEKFYTLSKKKTGS